MNLLWWGRHLFVPHYSNNHRAKTLHPPAFIFYISFLLLLQLSFSVLRIINPRILGLATDISVEKLLTLTNQKRQEFGLPPLNLDPQLSQAANLKVTDMISLDYWAHNSPKGLTPWVFIQNSGYKYSYAGENLAKNFANSEGVVSAWIASPTHRENILNRNYKDIGLAVVNGRLNGEETTLVVQMFGTRQAGTVATKPTVSSPQVFSSPQVGTVATKPTVSSPQVFSSPPATPMAGLGKFSPPQPLFDIFSLTKTISLVLAGILIGILGLDAVLVWRRKTVRISGHSLAHMLFLFSLLGIIWLTNVGMIL